MGFDWFETAVQTFQLKSFACEVLGSLLSLDILMTNGIAQVGLHSNGALPSKQVCKR